MKNSEITLRDAIEMSEAFCPIKIIFNGVVLYDDYYGEEQEAPLSVIPNRIWQFDEYIVTSMNIEIVEFHHSIVAMQGEYREED
jgi:hypothetical protein